MFGFTNQTLAKPVNCIQVTEVKEQENILELKCYIVSYTNSLLTTESTQHNINTEISFQMKAIFITERRKIERKINYGNSVFESIEKHPDLILVLFKFINKCPSDSTLYSICCNSASLSLANQTYVTDNDCWYLVYETKTTNLCFDILLTSKIIKRNNPFKSLYDDAQLTDLTLLGDEGSSVKIHSVVLMAQSTLVRKKINEKTIKDNVLEFKGIPGETLKHFKDYIYLQVLPCDNIEQLLLMASENEMQEMKHKCINKIMDSVTAKNYRHFTEYAQTHKIYELYFNLLECIQTGEVRVAELKKYYSTS